MIAHLARCHYTSHESYARIDRSRTIWKVDNIGLGWTSLQLGDMVFWQNSANPSVVSKGT